ncbi:hypothetical protein FD754_001484 [Muntiacus muntjak]|uniref:Securin n=1 Tax=Muntiacus muntjak TaxID=9888 RepID=A0A5N3W8S6_MUNMU|nr:hypothetical protein FD754_001484 [Muntiacus muntjak]
MSLTPGLGRAPGEGNGNPPQAGICPCTAAWCLAVWLLSTPRVGKMFDAPPALTKTARKALGTVNRATEKSVKTNEPLKQKQTTFSTKKITEKTEGKNFDLPEGHQIAHLPLNGVPLMILDEERELEQMLQV